MELGFCINRVFWFLIQLTPPQLSLGILSES